MPGWDTKSFTDNVQTDPTTGAKFYMVGSAYVGVGSPGDASLKANGIQAWSTTPTGETADSYRIGVISIPKGDPPSDKALKEFQAAQAAIGGTQKQIEVLGSARNGDIPGSRDPSTHPTPLEFVQRAQTDPKTGDVSIGNLHFGASQWPEYKDMILNRGPKDPALVGSLEKLANGPSEITLGESVPSKTNPDGQRLLSKFRPDEHGDMHYKNATIRKDDYALLAEMVNENPKTVDVIEREANAPAPHVVEVPRPDDRRVDSLENHVKNLALTANKDPEVQRVLESIPDTEFGNLAKKSAAIEKERLVDKEHINIVAGPDGKGAMVGPAFTVSGTVTNVEHNDKSGFTTVDITDSRGNERQISYKEPLGEDRYGKPIHNPLHKLEALDRKDAINLSIGRDGKSGTLEVPGRDGKPVELQIGQPAQLSHAGQSAGGYAYAR